MTTPRPNRILICAIAGTSLLALWSCDKGESPSATTGRDEAPGQPPARNAGESRPAPRSPAIAAKKNAEEEPASNSAVARTRPGAGSTPPPPAAPSAPASVPVPPDRPAPDAAPPAPEDPAVAQMQEEIRQHEKAMATAIGAGDLVGLERNYRAIAKLYGDSPSSFFAALSAIGDDLREQPALARAFFDRIADNPQTPALAAGFVQGLGGPDAQREWVRTVQNEDLRQKVAALVGLDP